MRDDKISKEQINQNATVRFVQLRDDYIPQEQGDSNGKVWCVQFLRL